MKFEIKQNDTLPPLKVKLTQTDGSVLDLTGATVKLVVNGIGEKTMVVEDAAQGIVRYDWQATDTAKAGVYLAEVKVQYPNGTRQTIPTIDTIAIHIYKEVVAGV